MHKLKPLIILYLCIIHTTSSKACSCVGLRSIKEEVRVSDVVFTGVVLSKRTFNVNDSISMGGFIIQNAEYSILVTKRLKGLIQKDTIKIITGIGGGDCGFPFLIGNEYIVYANFSTKYFQQGKKVDLFLTTNSCKRTKIKTKKEVRKISRYCLLIKTL